MKSAAIAFLLLPLVFPCTLASFIVNRVTAIATTCEPVLLQWQGGKAPWTLSVVAADGTSETLGTFKATSFHWPVDVEAGTVVAAQVTDSTGVTATSNSFTIQPGSTGCLPQNQFGVQPADSTTTQTSVQSTDTTTSSTADAETEAQPVATSSAPFSSGSISSAASSPSSTAQTASSSSLKQTTQPASSSAPKTSATISIQLGPYPSPSLMASSETTTRTIHVGSVFAILIPCLIVLIILGLCFVRWHRRRRGSSATSRGPSALEAQTSQPQWFDRPEYRQTLSSGHGTEIETEEVETQRPTLNIATNTGVAPSVGPQTAMTPGTSASNPGPVLPMRDAQTPASSYTKSPTGGSDPTAVDVQTLQSRIRVLMEENAVLADLARPPADVPPPAYA
ncbi:hypothetical protein DFH09DRAFT_1357753 [Mycena vulgaris]|nr:hypothetical protein DFH09DRAFT_1357753 [Mycena vulgaris]